GDRIKLQQARGIAFAALDVGCLDGLFVKHQRAVQDRHAMGEAARAVKNLLGQSVRVAGAKSIKPLILGQGLAEPGSALFNGPTLGREDLLELFTWGGIITIESVHEVGRPKLCTRRMTAGAGAIPASFIASRTAPITGGSRGVSRRAGTDSFNRARR